MLFVDPNFDFMASEAEEEQQQDREGAVADEGVEVTKEINAENKEDEEEANELLGENRESEPVEKEVVKEGKEDEVNVKEKAEESRGKEENEDEGEKAKEGEESKKVVRDRKKSSKKYEEKESEDKKEKIDRPIRERKTVERYSLPSPVSRSSASKPLAIVKGSGTPLKDIPNVAFKLSKRKPDDNLQLLHTILFGKKAKAYNLKRDIGKFSGFAWIDNEEKQRAKLREKLDKCVKEKLLDLCDVLNIPINKANVKKEDLSVKLLEFLESPHATTDLLLADKEQKGKGRRNKATPKEASAEKSTKKTQVGEKRERTSKVEEENENDEDDGHSDDKDDSAEEDDNEKAHKESSEHKEVNSEEEREEPKERITSPKGSFKERSGAKSTKGSTQKKKNSPEKSMKGSVKTAKSATRLPGKAAAESSASRSQAKGPPSKKQKIGKETPKDKRTEVSDKGRSKNQSGKTPVKPKRDQGKGKTSKKAMAHPSKEELHAVVVNILKEVDFNTATLSDILRQLGSHFSVDLMDRKAEVKEIITEVINNMSDEDDDDDDTGSA
ncbi:hypothetical protein Nepgr_033338 [Nepenthes gracilis]|uniref:DEK-C domain-containing protein n=1 Tax=Nepenthes gracilis TaxID=150966 RepID=A0AAD3TL10_NEPGR|nr:hypothetical protein Nepgr_033338 [Nepenthes gracilis]